MDGSAARRSGYEAAHGRSCTTACRSPPVARRSRTARARTPLGLPSGRVVVTFTGQVIERKGVADLIRAWARLPADLAGRGAELS